MEKLKISLKYWLLGRKYFQALKAMEFAEKFHNGKRKSGEPEFIHQLTIVQFLRTFETSLKFPEETFISGFLHDTPEDYDLSFVEIENQFGSFACKAIKALTKKFRGVRLPDEAYYDQISENVISSVVKGADRIHNHQSMVDVFSIEKQKSYIDETKVLVLPALKKARNKFVEQEPVYENMKLILNSQISLFEKIHSAIENK